MIRSLVFDVDDTLYLERDYVRSGFAAVGRFVEDTAGIASFADLCWTFFLDGKRGDIFDRAAKETGLVVSPDMLITLVGVYRTHEPDIKLAADAAAALPGVISDVRCAVVTDGPVESQSRKVKALGADRFADPVVLTAELGPNSGKPSTDAFALIERRHSITGGDCVYVADNPTKDFAGPKALGWRTVRIRREHGLHRDRPSGPDVDSEIESLVDLKKVLGTL